MARYRFQVFQVSTGAPERGPGHWIGAGLVLVIAIGILFLVFAIGWFVLLITAALSIPLLAWSGLRNWRQRHAAGPVATETGNRLLEGEWRPVGEPKDPDDGPAP